MRAVPTAHGGTAGARALRGASGRGGAFAWVPSAFRTAGPAAEARRRCSPAPLGGGSFSNQRARRRALPASARPSQTPEQPPDPALA